LPDSMDPDEVIKKLGVEEYEKLLFNAKPLIDFKLDVLKKYYDLNTVDGKRKFASGAIRVIRESPSATEQEDLLKQIKEITGFTFDSLKRELYSEENVKKEALVINSETVSEEKNKVISASRFVLTEFLYNKPYTEEVNLKEIDFNLPVHNEIKDFILAKKSKGESLRFNELYEESFDENKEELNRLAELITDDTKKFNRKAYFDDCLKIIALDALDKKIDMIKKLFSEETDGGKRIMLTKELSEAVKQKNKIIRQK
jgi:DNA primase